VTPRGFLLCPLSAAVLAAGLAGCHADAAAVRTDGPVSVGGDPGELCLPRPTDTDELTYGLDVLKVEGDKPVTLSGVSLVDPSNLAVADAYLVPVHDQNLVGNWSTWPPPESALTQDGVDWVLKRPLHDVVLDPGADQPTENLVLHLAVNGSEGSFEAVTISYTSDDTDYRATTSTRVLARDVCD
jgi:hypothetical protein